MKYIFLLISLLFSTTINAQTFSAQVDPPTIGKVCPDFSVSIITPSGNEKNIQLSALRGKVVILEFWATYCAPCIPSLSHFERIKKQYGDAVEIIAISDENRDKVDTFLSKRNYPHILFGMDWGHRLNELFFHHFIPHTVVIDKKGVVKAFTSPEEIDADIVGKLLRNQRVDIVMKQEFQQQATATSTVSSGSVVKANPVQVSNPNELRIQLGQYEEGRSTEFIKESENEYKFINCTLLLIYQILYEQKASRLKVELDNMAKYTSEPANQYCLSVHVPEFLGKTVKDIAIVQLEQLFPLRAKIEPRSQTVLALERSDTAVTVSSTDSTGIIQKGLTIKDLVNFLESNPHLVNNLSVVNNTGLADSTLIDLDWFQNYSDSVSNKLKTLGLKAVEKTMNLDCLIFYEDKRNLKDTP